MKNEKRNDPKKKKKKKIELENGKRVKNKQTHTHIYDEFHPSHPIVLHTIVSAWDKWKTENDATDTCPHF